MPLRSSWARASCLTIVFAGCSGASATDLFDGPSEQSNTSATLPTPAPGASATGSTSLPGAPPSDAGSDVVVAAPPPVPTCTPEAEPNGDLDHATRFSVSLCGALDSNTDVDYGTIVVPAGAKRATVAHEEKNGNVSYRVYLDGQVIPVALDSLAAIPGTVYGVQIRHTPGPGNASERPTYQLKVSFD